VNVVRITLGWWHYFLYGDAMDTLTVLVYSDDRNTREQVTVALGRRPAADLPELAYLECATSPAVLRALEKGGIDLCILDGEAVPAGGLGLARQLKDEIYGCPPVLVLIGRPQDAWLAAWSRADAAISQPVDPVGLADAVAQLLRTRMARRTPAHQ
jgi:DNA-binding response OmpR family regulator